MRTPPLLRRSLLRTAAGTLGLAALPHAAAAVPEAAASRLHADLTPIGAERAGTPDGRIPPWTGTVPSADRLRQEKPILTISSANAPAYEEALPEGALALLRHYADFRMNIYPTHRSATAPDAVYQATFRNALRAAPAPEGIAYGVQGAAGGVPFPIPRSGGEIVWNHLLAFWGAAREDRIATYIAAGDGSVERSAAYREITDFPYYAPGATPAGIGPYYFKTRRLQEAPPSRAGEGYIAWQPLDTARDPYVAWRYIPGEHRVRRAPSLSYDTPDADAEGMEALDEYYLFFGGPDRYDFRILGKRPMFVPYNNERLYDAAPRDYIGPRHENPDLLRYELHRVWIVEGTLAAGKHHVVPRRRLYIDEDTWLVLASDSWDENGKLWKYGHGTMLLLRDVPTIVTGTQFIYDLLLGGYVADFVLEHGRGDYRTTPPHAPDRFSPESMAADALR